MTIHPFETLDRLRLRMAEAIISQSGLRHPVLADHLRRTLGASAGDGALIPPPVLEGAFPFIAATETLGALAGRVLDSRTVDALAGDDTGQGYSFPRSRFPYLHQLDAWKILTAHDPKSVVVTAGTGSGKTECFLVPLLDSLYRRDERVVGVEAIMLYPLNALIASQQERLDAWTRGARGRIRYCLYNGNLDEGLDGRRLKESLATEPQKVPDRKTLRIEPPPLLVTNPTMLEYMLVRPQDRPILDASRGRLKWIILDEAHTLVGSAAAEIALLLRRTMEAFEVDPKDVRFVATSATIGEGPDVKQQLRRFLAAIGGIDISQVDVISGDRRLPQRPRASIGAPDAKAIAALPPQALYELLGGYAPIWSLIEDLKSGPAPAAKFDEIAGTIGVSGETLAMALTRAKSSVGEILAPLRVHSFHRAMPGLWCCTNPACPDAMGDGEGWGAGKILFRRQENCPACNMPVAELFTCNECGTAFMMTEEIGDRLIPPRPKPPTDEFVFEADRDSSPENDEEAELVRPDGPSVSHCFSLSDGGLMTIYVDRSTGRTCDSPNDGRYRLSGYGGNGKGPCPACGASNRNGDKLYPFRFGAPFIIGNAAPILLAAMPPSATVEVPHLPQVPPELPASGRQLISFTDSRQGTARMAAKLQIESERAFVRSYIYQAVQHRAAGTGETDETVKLRQNITQAKSRPNWHEDGLISGLVRDWEAQLNGKTGAVGTISWIQLRNELADRPEVRDWLTDVWGNRAELFRKDNASAAAQLADALLLREFMRRPRHANSPETMGLARIVYPTIEKLTEAPRGFIQRSATLDDWKAWLTSIVMFSVRNYLAVAVNRDVLQWIMRKGFPKNLAGPGQKPGGRQQGWPYISANAQPQVGDLLHLGLGLNVGSKSDRDEMNDWLARAWQQLQPLFTLNASGEQALDFSRVEIGVLRQAFLCPVTHRIVDVAPFGLTPYAKAKAHRAEALTMPILPANGDGSARQAFVQSDEAVAELRRKGLWTDMHDRIALFSPYARSAEHSAQLPPERLRHYENAFKAGLINLLNCSTTMEMGVDIGSVNGVLMTNVPPSIANYRQRVGRAGRRGQPLSLAFTFAKDRPLDIEAFGNPAAYLQRTISAPVVSLDSRPIVQRHVNAFLLARFLVLRGGNPMRMKAGDFFGCPAAPRVPRPLKDERPVAQFGEWLGLATTADSMAPAIQRLVRGSVLDGRSDLVDACRMAVEGAEKEMVAEWRALQDQLPGADDMGATAALKNHLKRLCDEFLLSDLADRGFLPGHGFPTNVVSFELGRQQDEGNEDGRPGQRHGGPKRPLDIAIRDYAPGAETVVDGQVYRVGGVTLNWHRPSSEGDAREIQALRWAARCMHCGDSWTGTGGYPETCRSCGASELEATDYLKPAGFLRDRREAVHAEVDRVDFVPSETAKISAGTAPWEALSTPDLGRFRVNRRGTVFYHTKGPTGEGYGLCLHCGRMEPMQAQEFTCSGLANHKPLRAIENYSQPCPGNGKNFALRAKLELGYELHTDVLELQPAATLTPGAANALAIALREAIAQYIGVEPDEMGYGIAPSRNAMATATISIFLYDRASGGAGYVVSAAPHMRSIIRRAKEILHCPRDCKRACSACVLVSDAPEREDELDRYSAIAFLDQHLQLAEDIAREDRFTNGADISERPLSEIDSRLNSAPGRRLILWTQAPDITALEDWPPTALFRRWSSNGKEIVLVVPEGTISRLDGAQRLYLRDYSNRHGIKIAEGETSRFSNGAVLFAFVGEGETGAAWACRDAAVLEAGPDWGAKHAMPIAWGETRLTVGFKPIESDHLKAPANAVVRMLDASLDGPISNFGARMASAIRKAAQECGLAENDGIAFATYHDRYARSPLVLKLLTDTVSDLAKSTTIPLSVVTAYDRGGGFSRNQIASDVERDDALVDLVQAYGKCRGLDNTVSIGQPPHKRSLALHFRSGAEIVVDFDQGFGWLVYEGNDRLFNASFAAASSAQKLLQLMGRVKRRYDHDSQMVVWRRTAKA